MRVAVCNVIVAAFREIETYMGLCSTQFLCRVRQQNHHVKEDRLSYGRLVITDVGVEASF